MADFYHRQPQILSRIFQSPTYTVCLQRAKKVVSDSPGLVDFAIELVSFELTLPFGQVKFFFRDSN